MQLLSDLPVPVLPTYLGYYFTRDLQVTERTVEVPTFHCDKKEFPYLVEIIGEIPRKKEPRTLQEIRSTSTAKSTGYSWMAGGGLEVLGAGIALNFNDESVHGVTSKSRHEYSITVDSFFSLPGEYVQFCIPV